MIKINTEDMLTYRPIIREISFLRQLTKMPGNVYTTRLYDVITPPDDQPLDRVFLVMECVDYSLKDVFGQDTNDFSSDHVIIILYNLLCALNFIHTAGIMHRDIKPANILMNSRCVVTICDFGLARTVDRKIEEE